MPNWRHWRGASPACWQIAALRPAIAFCFGVQTPPSGWRRSLAACLRGVIAVPLDAAGSVDFATRVIADVTPRLIVGDQEHLQKTAARIDAGFRREPLPSKIFLPPCLARRCLNRTLLSTRKRRCKFSLLPAPRRPPKALSTRTATSCPASKCWSARSKNICATNAGCIRCAFLHTLPLSHVFGQFMGLWVPPLLAAQVHYEDNLVASHVMETDPSRAHLRRRRGAARAGIAARSFALQRSAPAGPPQCRPEPARLEKMVAHARHASPLRI